MYLQRYLYNQQSYVPFTLLRFFMHILDTFLDIISRVCVFEIFPRFVQLLLSIFFFQILKIWIRPKKIIFLRKFHLLHVWSSFLVQRQNTGFSLKFILTFLPCLKLYLQFAHFKLQTYHLINRRSSRFAVTIQYNHVLLFCYIMGKNLPLPNIPMYLLFSVQF